MFHEHVNSIQMNPENFRWLLLIHQLPAKPAYLRVKVWRRLQALGAVAVKNAVYALPCDDQTHRRTSSGCCARSSRAAARRSLCEARFVDGLSDQEVRALFDAARDADYDELAKRRRALAA